MRSTQIQRADIALALPPNATRQHFDPMFRNAVLFLWDGNGRGQRRDVVTCQRWHPKSRLPIVCLGTSVWTLLLRSLKFPIATKTCPNKGPQTAPKTLPGTSAAYKGSRLKPDSPSFHIPVYIPSPQTPASIAAILRNMSQAYETSLSPLLESILWPLTDQQYGDLCKGLMSGWDDCLDWAQCAAPSG